MTIYDSSKRTARPSSSLFPPHLSCKKQRRSTPSAQDRDLERLHRELVHVAASIQKGEHELDELNTQLKTIDTQLLTALEPDTPTYLQSKESLRNEEGAVLQKAKASESLALRLPLLLPLPDASSPLQSVFSQPSLSANISHHQYSWHRKIPLILLLPSTLTPSEQP